MNSPKIPLIIPKIRLMSPKMLLITLKNHLKAPKMPLITPKFSLISPKMLLIIPKIQLKAQKMPLISPKISSMIPKIILISPKFFLNDTNLPFQNVHNNFHEAKTLFHYEIIPSINAMQFHKFGIGIYHSKYCCIENSFLILFHDCAKPFMGRSD